MTNTVISSSVGLATTNAQPCAAVVWCARNQEVLAPWSAATECIDYLATCNFCDTLQGEDACISIPLIEDTFSVYSGCIAYESGPFDNVICDSENFIDNTCTITIDGTECSSCTVIDCDGFTDYDIDWSNIIAGETWNLCTADIPETSPFISFGNNDRFEDPSCSEAGGGALEFCQLILEAQFGADAGCTCEPDGEDFIVDWDCDITACETIQGEETCVLLDEEAASAVEAGPDECLTYTSGPFNNTICTIDVFVDDTCTITIDGEDCSSCTVVDSDSDTDYDIDCSNIIAGETWNLCTADIPETSPFISFGTIELFDDPSCSEAGGGGGGKERPGGGGPHRVKPVDEIKDFLTLGARLCLFTFSPW
jgi:hypothetical protein